MNRGEQRAGSLSDNIIVMPESSDFVSPIIATIVVQLLAYHSAVHLGTDVDQPRNLAKLFRYGGVIKGGVVLEFTLET